MLLRESPASITTPAPTASLTPVFGATWRLGDVLASDQPVDNALATCSAQLPSYLLIPQPLHLKERLTETSLMKCSWLSHFRLYSRLLEPNSPLFRPYREPLDVRPSEQRTPLFPTTQRVRSTISKSFNPVLDINVLTSNNATTSHQVDRANTPTFAYVTYVNFSPDLPPTRTLFAELQSFPLNPSSNHAERPGRHKRRIRWSGASG